MFIIKGKKWNPGELEEQSKKSKWRRVSKHMKPGLRHRNLELTHQCITQDGLGYAVITNSPTNLRAFKPYRCISHALKFLCGLGNFLEQSSPRHILSDNARPKPNFKCVGMHNLPVFWEQRRTGYLWAKVMVARENRRETWEAKISSKPKWRPIQEHLGVWNQDFWVWGRRAPLKGSNECHHFFYPISNQIEKWEVRICWWNERSLSFQTKLILRTD